MAAPGRSRRVSVVAKRLRGPARRPLADRLWERVNRDGPTMPGMESPCWEWTGLTNPDGYGQISLGGHCGKMVGAHRAAWMVTHPKRKIPKGKLVCHRCDNPKCCRAEVGGGHLFLGTHAENMADAKRKGRIPGPAALGVDCANRGERNGRARLTPAQVEDIRARYGILATARELAAEYGVSVYTIRAAGQGRSWRHLEPEPVMAKENAA